MRFNRRQLAISAAGIPLFGAIPAVSQSATPSSLMMNDLELAAASSRITSLGQYVPGGTLDGVLDLNWIDIERQLFRIARGTEGEERRKAFMESGFGSGPPYLSVMWELEEAIGFGVLNILQAISANPPPDTLQMFRLDVDVTELPALWAQSGYEERENDFGRYWTIGENAEMDLQHPIQGVALASVNNIALLDDRTLAFAPTSESLGQVMGTINGETPTILAGLAPVTEALPETAIAAWYVDGTRLRYSAPGNMGEAQAAQLEEFVNQSDDAAGKMPVVRTVGVGTTEGASRDPNRSLANSVAFAILEVESDVETAVDVITWRHENLMSVVNGRPYRELLGEIEIEIVGDHVLRVSSHDGASISVFSQMLNRADTLLFSYRP